MGADPYKLPFEGLKKIQVLHQLQPLFKAKVIKPRDCIEVITKLLYVIGQENETVTDEEAEEVYIASTMLVMNEDQKLRRMMYLIIKTLAKYSDKYYVAVNSLSHDMTRGFQKAAAIRTLRYIADGTTFGQLDRHLEQAIVDQNPAVASSALISAYHLSEIDMEGVKRWQKKIQTQLSARNHMVQYHALAVLYKLRQHDHLAVSKLVSSNTNTIRSRLGHSLLIRYATRVLNSTGDRQLASSLLKYLHSCLTSYASDIIIVEAAKALCSIPNLPSKHIEPAVTALKNVIINSSSEPVKRYAAIRILSSLAKSHEDLLASVAHIIRDLISSPNRHISTLATTTLLVCVDADNLDALLDRVASFITEIPDEYKLTVVEGLQKLSKKFPEKNGKLLSFLDKCLQEGGYSFRNAVVEAMMEIMKSDKSLLEDGLDYLVNFIEDCDYTKLLQRVLHYIGEFGPQTKNPSKFIRYIYNRIALENASVRTAAVIAISKFAATVQSVRPSVIVILKRILLDDDDEVRDRAVMCLAALTDDDDQDAENSLMNEVLLSSVDIDVNLMEKSLYVYVNSDDHANAFTLDNISEHISEEVKTVEEAAAEEEEDDVEVEELVSSPKSTPVASFQSLFGSEESLAKLSEPIKSTTPKSLTEPDADYVVQLRKHIFANHVGLQFIVKNGIDTQLLTGVHIQLENNDSESNFDEDNILSIEADQIRYGQSGQALLVLPKAAENALATGSFAATLTFVALDVDPSTGDIEDEEGNEDEIELDEDVMISVIDYLVEEKEDNFKSLWPQMESQWESGVIELSDDHASLDEAVTFLEFTLGLDTLSCESPKENLMSVTFNAKTIDDEATPLLIAARFKMKDDAISMKAFVRSTNEDLCESVGDFIESIQ
mmetsp:Transcript_5677/g.8372  ORF Transcript_5677/g.8372 Transcript_5677/m.8372 type:complete len:888 (+) Transcript_5677:39-2702(+)